MNKNADDMEYNNSIFEFNFLIPTTSTFNNNESVFETWSTSELVEMSYQMLLFIVGAPLNIYAILKFSR